MNKVIEKITEHPIAFSIAMGAIVGGIVKILGGIAEVISAANGVRK